MLQKYTCRKCKESVLAFDNENRLTTCKCGDYSWDMLPPCPVVVHATESFMSVEVRLDSHCTIYELDRVLNIEAREEKELAIFNNIRKDL